MSRDKNEPPDRGTGDQGVEQLARGNNHMVATNMLQEALRLASAGWPVFPLASRDKVPAIASPHLQGTVARRTCRGECGYFGHGVWDASTDDAQVERMWAGRPQSNIGIALTEHTMVVDTDPRNGGAESIDLLEARYGELPVTLTAASGRGDGGLHRYYSRPVGRITDKLLGAGVDLKSHGGYVVAPPSIHPATGLPYTWLDLAPVADPPAWLVELIRVQPAPVKTYTPRPVSLDPFRSTSIADTYCTSATWSDVLGPHGWRLLDPDPDADGSRWLHPSATSKCSATVRDACLFVWSSNTPLDQSTAGDPRGYTKFRAYAVLNFHGDLSAAAKHLAHQRQKVAA